VSFSSLNFEYFPSIYPHFARFEGRNSHVIYFNVKHVKRFHLRVRQITTEENFGCGSLAAVTQRARKMVEFEEIKDEHYEPKEDDGFETEQSDDYSDASESDIDEEDDIANETLFDRIAALKDIIPAEHRDSIARMVSTTISYGSMATFIGGKAIYILMTTLLMGAIPFALAVEEERMLSEQERQMQLQQGMSEVFLVPLQSNVRYLRPQPQGQ
jgi:mitochondrial import receptor subunit TOM22